MPRAEINHAIVTEINYVMSWNFASLAEINYAINSWN